jgi:hypothetical protein
VVIREAKPNLATGWALVLQGMIFIEAFEIAPSGIKELFVKLMSSIYQTVFII